MNIARRMVRNWQMLVALLVNTSILGLYTLVRPDVEAGRFVAGFALGLILLVLTSGYYRAREADLIESINDRAARIAAKHAAHQL